MSGETTQDKSRGKKILILVENLPVPFDRRVWLEAQTLTKNGYQVSVICPQGSERRPYDEIDGVKIYRYPPPPPTRSKLSYLFEFPYCWFATAWLSLKVLKRDGFDAIHACNPPDTFFLLGLIYKLLGKRFVYDQHDLCPELYISRFRGSRRVLYSVLRLLERLTYRTSDIVLSTNRSYRENAMERGNMPPERIYIVRSGPSTSTFKPVPANPSLKDGKDYLICYLGVMAPQDGVDYLIRAIRHIVDVVGRKDIKFVLIGKGDSYKDLRLLVSDLKLDEFVSMPGRLPDSDVAEYLSSSDLCVSPDPWNELNDVSTMNKTLEYMTVGKPVVCFDLKETRFSAGEGALYAVPNDEIEFGEMVLELLDDPERREEMGKINRDRILSELSWEHTSKELVRAYDDLFESEK
jgi:glycosyltransferase involved in cell wall biosynthesis